MKNNILLLPAFLLLSGLFFSCRKKIEPGAKEYSFDFKETTQGWNVFFSDYPVDEENNYELSFEYTALPGPLDNSIKSLKVSGNNHSDDLLSLIYRKIDGLKPNMRYAVTFSLELASNACISCAGVGGSPNLSLGAGGLSYEPANNIVQTGPFNYYRPNFTTEIQSGLSNNVMQVLGRIGVGEGSNIPYTLIKQNNNSNPIYLTTNARGELWLIIGIDSGFEATTTLYYKQIAIVLIQQ